jgi:putative CocE/NonD family hydrolase
MGSPAKVVVYKDVMIPMADGVRLATDIYLPSGAGPFPALLTRTPYGKGGMPPPMGDPSNPYGAAELAARGYAVAVQDKRGKYGSEGAYPGVMMNDGAGVHKDGADTVEWLAAQPWCNGKVAAWGVSYMGHTTMGAAMASPAHLMAGMSAQPATDVFTEERFVDGAYRIEVGFWTVINAADLARHLPEAERGQAMAEIGQFAAAGERVYRTLPITDIPLQRRFPMLWADVLKRRDDPAYFEESSVTAERAKDIKVPLLHIGAWYDPFLRNSIRQFELVSANAADPAVRDAQRLILGPWRHGAFGEEVSGQTRFPGAAIDYSGLAAAWSGHWLKGEPAPAFAKNKVTVYVMGENRWRAEPSWPPPGMSPTPFHLRAGGGLTSEAPAAAEGSDVFTYDPANPYTAPNVAAGMNAQNLFMLGSNVLVYTTPPLKEPMEASGPVTANLFAASSATDADWFVELHDVSPQGQSMLVTEGVCRARYRRSRTRPEPLTPGQVERYEIDLRSTSIVFKPGHRIRVIVTGGKFPYLERNPQAFVDLNTCTEKDFQVATQIIVHDADHPSAINLPLVPIREDANWIDNPCPLPASKPEVQLDQRAAGDLPS